MKNNFEKLKSFIQDESTQDLLEKTFTMLAVAYLLLFGAETILPGLVMNILNINYLLFALLGVLSVFIFSRRDQEGTFNRKGRKFFWFFSSMLIFLSGVLVIALYEVSLVESLFYLLLTLIITRLIWDNV